MIELKENNGEFYLGSDIDEPSKAVYYNAKDLTTHAVIVGMTGSGKTGLGICLLEEAALDGIAVIAIDPKGDLGNLALNFPELRAQDFMPWADTASLAQQDTSVEHWAEHTAAQWRNGIINSGQSRARMQALKQANSVTVYTPGSNNGVSLSLLADLAPPAAEIRQDFEGYAEALDASAAALLALCGFESDPLSPVHVFITHILRHYWDQNQTLSLAELIKAILRPPFDTIGVMALDDFISASKRSDLANQFNSLFAAPSFASWQHGEPLSCAHLFYDADQKPRTSVLNIAHLSDDERMFFVTILLANLISWMRQQSGTGNLRAILYIDEIMGYLPPTANPPSKQLLLTLLKQARAYGLGLVLSTQNPIDLDYKALSNAGTWFVGRLQTAQDRKRLQEGLLSAHPSEFARQDLNAAFAQLDKRTFLLHDIHEKAPRLFHTRWAMSYLAGPMDKARLQLLNHENANIESPVSADAVANTPPVLPPDIHYYYSHTQGNTNQQITHYQPWIMVQLSLYYTDKKSDTRHQLKQIMLANASDKSLHWQVSERLENLETNPRNPAYYQAAAMTLSEKKTWNNIADSIETYLSQQYSLTLYYAQALGVYSQPEESEQQFRQRISDIALKAQALAQEKVNKQYASKQATLERQILTAQNQLDTQQRQSKQSWINAGISIGSAIFGAFTGRSNRSNTTTALRRASQIGKERQDVAAAQAKLDLLEKQAAELKENQAAALVQISTEYDPQQLQLTPYEIYLSKNNINIESLATVYIAK